MAREISNHDDTIDSRDIIERIEELERDKEIAEDPEHPDPDYFTEDEADELRKLKALAKEAEGYAPDWRYGATLVRDSHFPDYAQSYFEEVVDSEVRKQVQDAGWPFNHLDWKAAAEELQVDYTGVDFDGETYWVR
jgi:hypothetical protein